MKEQWEDCDGAYRETPNESVAASDGARDSALARRILLKDPEAMAELYDRHGAFTHSVLVAILRDRWIAEELSQEVFLRVWNAIDRFDERRGGLKQWIAAIARNKALDYLRSRDARLRRRELALNRLPRAARQDSFEERMLTEELVRASRNATQQLTEKQRQVFRLTYFEGKTQSQIAAELDAPLGSVKTWVRAGLKRLRKELVAGSGKACMSVGINHR